MGENGFSIGGISIYPPTVLAPLAGITSPPFRKMVKRQGCGLVCSEMISANGLVFGTDLSFKMIENSPDEKPLSIQLFGADPDIMAEAARKVEASGADILDINFGCSVKKVVKTGAGVALMKDPDLSRAIISAVRKAVKIPLTIKIRSGYDQMGTQAFRIAEIAEECGVNAVCLHPRTAGQAFRGKADWHLITHLKKRLSIPLIGNGDIASPADAVNMFKETGCDGIMIGRACLSNPAIFRETMFALENKKSPMRSLDDHFSMMLDFIDDSVDYHGEKIACQILRGQLGWLVKGLPGAVAFRQALSVSSSKEETTGLIHRLRESVRGNNED